MNVSKPAVIAAPTLRTLKCNKMGSTDLNNIVTALLPLFLWCLARLSCGVPFVICAEKICVGIPFDGQGPPLFACLALCPEHCHCWCLTFGVALILFVSFFRFAATTAGFSVFILSFCGTACLVAVLVNCLSFVCCSAPVSTKNEQQARNKNKVSNISAVHSCGESLWSTAIASSQVRVSYTSRVAASSAFHPLLI